MEITTPVITRELRENINNYVGKELIPSCAIGNPIFFDNGNIIFETFDQDGVSGARMLTQDGEIINLIQEKEAEKITIISDAN
jgi:hypothetical protein